MPKNAPRVSLPKALFPVAGPPPWLHLGNRASAWVETARRRVPLRLVSAGSPLLLKPQAAEGPALFVLRHTTRSQRASMEREGVSYVDPAGYFLHLATPEVLVHFEAPGWARSRAARQAPAGQLRLGPAAVRVAMAALLTPGGLAIARLGGVARASLAQTHQALRLLEDAGFVSRVGRGPQTSRSLQNPRAVADLLRDTALRQRRAPAVPVFVYARKPEELWEKVCGALGERGVLSGAAAATVLGGPSAGATAIPRTTVRVASSLGVREAVGLLGAKPADAGANLLLVADKARWGDVLPREAGKLRVANPVCVWLDCLREPRGEDVAQHFRETTLGF